MLLLLLLLLIAVLVSVATKLTVAAGAVVLRAVLLYAGSGGGGLGLRVVVWNNNVPATAIPFHYSGQVLMPTAPLPFLTGTSLLRRLFRL